MNKPILRKEDLGLMQISDIIYMVLAKDEKRLGVQLYKTQTLNIQTMGYGETQYALPSFEIALANFNKRIHIDYKKKFEEQVRETNELRKYIREKLRHFIDLEKCGDLITEDLEETLNELI